MKAIFGWKKTFGILTLLATVAILFAACGGDDDPTPGPTAASTLVPGTPAVSVPSPEAKAEPQIGAELIGTLEGPTVITDTSRWPTTFQEAPMLAALVADGKLPPVDQRVPQEPLVVEPVHEIGEYGGIWRRAFTGPADNFNGYRQPGIDNVLYWNFDGTEVIPWVAKGWDIEDGGRTFVVHLRKGMKWSDGAPFTADDFMFWYEDMYLNDELLPSKPAVMTINGKPAVMEKRDDLTIVWKFPDPHFAMPEIMAGQNALAGLSQNGRSNLGPYSPKHYMKQFHTDYAGEAAVDKIVKDEGYDNWVVLFKAKGHWSQNVDLPVLTAWTTIKANNTPTWILERNPYSMWVDTAGNQLPYLDRVVMTLAEDLEVLNLRAIAGEIDMQSRHIDMRKLPVFLQNQENGGYKVHLDVAGHASDVGLSFNQSYEGDPEIVKWLTNVDFRRALSMGVKRDQIHETFWLGMGIPGAALVADENPYNPGPEWRTKWSTYQPDQANQLLDSIGLDKKDSDGFRLRSDGEGRLRIELLTSSGTFFPLTELGEAIKEHWAEIGIFLDVKEVERSLRGILHSSNDFQIDARSRDGTENWYTHSPGGAIPSSGGSSTGPLFGVWFQSMGEKGVEPPPRMREVFDLYTSGFGVPYDERVIKIQDAWKIMVDDVWTIGTVTSSPAVNGVRIASVGLGNVPDRSLNSAAHKSLGPSIPQTLYWKDASKR